MASWPVAIFTKRQPGSVAAKLREGSVGAK
jgi:hypothetical protein